MKTRRHNNNNNNNNNNKTVAAVLCAAFAFAIVLFMPTQAEARGCTERSDIVGEQKCSRFGSLWSSEGQFPITFHFGGRYSELSTADTTFIEETAKQPRPTGYKAYRYSGESLGVKSLGGLGVDGGFNIYIHGQLYMGIDGGIAMGTASTAAFTTSSGVQLSRDGGPNVFIWHGGIPIGYRIPLGRASIRPEVLFGVAQVDVDHHVSYPGLPSTGTASETRGLIETRIVGDIWFTQHISFGAYAGMNVLDFDGRSRAFGLSLTWHMASFDGDSSY